MCTYKQKIPVRARFYAPVQTGPGAHPASCTVGTRSFPGVKSGRGVTLTPHPLLVLWSRKSIAIPLLPYGPFGLYRASVPVQGCTLAVLFTLLYRTSVPVQGYTLAVSFYAVVKSLSACTRVHISCTFLRCCTEPQCLYKGAH